MQYKSISQKYFKTLANFLINNFTIHNSKILLEVASIALGGYSSSMLADLFLHYYYEICYVNNSLHL